MTTRNYPPVLDRKITRLIPAASPGNDPWGNSIPPDEDDAKKLPVWATRRDFSARDFVEAGNLGLITVSDSRFIVRALGPPWSEGDQFTDDEGFRRTVRGVSNHGDRGRYLEVLGRRLG